MFDPTLGLSDALDMKNRRASVEIIKNDKPRVIAVDTWVSPRIQRIAGICESRGIPYAVGYSDNESAVICEQSRSYARWFANH